MNKKNGFTLVELLMVVIIIGILITLAIPNYYRTIERSKGSKARNNLRALQETEIWYRAHEDTYCGDINILGGWGFPLGSLTNDPDWTYDVPVSTSSALEVRATRTGGPYDGSTMSVDEGGIFTMSLSGIPW
ncbi:MAG: type II secretion system protein [Candidatus Omnitrophota bacterium]